MKQLTLTFDNGPDPDCTPEVLDALGERGIHATFFVCGRGTTRDPRVVEREIGRNDELLGDLNDRLRPYMGGGVV